MAIDEYMVVRKSWDVPGDDGKLVHVEGKVVLRPVDGGLIAERLVRSIGGGITFWLRNCCGVVAEVGHLENLGSTCPVGRFRTLARELVDEILEKAGGPVVAWLSDRDAKIYCRLFDAQRIMEMVPLKTPTDCLIVIRGSEKKR